MLEVAAKKLGLVTRAEHRKSRVQEEEAGAFLEEEEKANDKKEDERKEKEETEDLVRCLGPFPDWRHCWNFTFSSSWTISEGRSDDVSLCPALFKCDFFILIVSTTLCCILKWIAHKVAMYASFVPPKYMYCWHCV